MGMTSHFKVKPSLPRGECSTIKKKQTSSGKSKVNTICAANYNSLLVNHLAFIPVYLLIPQGYKRFFALMCIWTFLYLDEYHLSHSYEPGKQ